MTMLQQILETMHIDKELLVELPDDLKQVLFYKMRQEQVRRWMEYDDQCETGEYFKNNPRKCKKKCKTVEILADSRGDPWTWVLDETYEGFSSSGTTQKSSASILISNGHVNGIQSDSTVLSASSIDNRVPDQRIPTLSSASERDKEINDALIPLDSLRLKPTEEDVAEHAWQEQEEKAKKAELEARNKARQARSRQLTAKDIDVIMAHYRQNQKSLWTEFSERPQSRNDVVRWFRRRELQRRSITDDYGCIPPWFHGLISRNEAESLLGTENVKIGSFLVRLNERIWGYAVSYKHVSGFKHFLIAALDDCYQVVGQNQPTFKTLVELVSYYKSRPISFENGELLLKPVPRSNCSGLSDLFDMTTDSSV